jgi:DNA repair protein endonuclease SAE2/CtIP C-terminus
VGPLPPRLEAPRWSSQSPPTLVASDSAYHSDGDSGGAAAAGVDCKCASAGVSAHRDAVSRHRAQWERAPTPPGYWDIGFPDTQAVEKINEKAAEIHRQKRAAVAKEAMEEGGRYRRRA